MDKYTVDLDQVLNDFEYSELRTDSYSSDHHQPNLAKTSNVVKHSITNVFNSLTEYLNTDIAPIERVKEKQQEEMVQKVEEKEEINCDENKPIEVNEKCLENESIVELVDDNIDIVEETDGCKISDDDETVTVVLCDVEDDNNNATDDIEGENVDNSQLISSSEVVPSISHECVDDLVEVQVQEEEKRKVGFMDLNLDETDIDQAFEELEKEFQAENVIVVEVEEIEAKAVDKEEPGRPQDLDVKKDGDEGKRKINLIGDPGSTPYNNVYISNEISEAKLKHDAGDYSTSESPTFSDEPSETSSGSTTSTEAIHDEQDKNSIADTAVVEETGDESAIGAAALPPTNNGDYGGEIESSSREFEDNWLGKQAPLWIPDADALTCLQCDMKFTVIKRRHHCRACGLVLCSKCCNSKYKLDYLEQEARVCTKCFAILSNRSGDTVSNSSGSEISNDTNSTPVHRPNPNNPLEYCSTVSPLQQVNLNNQNTPSVMVPVGVLKREGSAKGRSNKSVIFCDGIRPGSDLTNLDTDFNYSGRSLQKNEKVVVPAKRSFPSVDSGTGSFIPSNGMDLPPAVTFQKTDVTYAECDNDASILEHLKNEPISFALHLNLYVHVRIISMDCCVNKTAFCFSTEGLINVGQDEIVILLELLDDETVIPKDVLLHLNNIYFDAVKGTTVKETGVSLHNSSVFLDSKNHAGFIYIRPTFECLRKVIVPKEPFLIGILIHRWETPWAKLFPLRLILRLGAEYRYYPSPIISTRHRDSMFVEIGQTIINLLADFKNFTFTLPQIRGLTIHMEDKKTTINIPINRYDQVMKLMTNSSDHILAFAGSFSLQADSHLVCIQETQGNENGYTTHAINIHNKPRKVTGASFIVFNGALKSTSGLTAKSNIVEDGLMIQILPEHMLQLRDSLKNMKNHTIQCGCVNAVSDETVHVIWCDMDTNFNTGINSPIDNKSMSGIPSIRVHNGKDYVCNSKNRLIRWTEVFIIQNGDEGAKNQDPVDISKISESIAKAACSALVKYLDLLITNNFYKIAIRANLHVENVSYAAGSNSVKLPPIYMKTLDNSLIPVLHRITSNNFGENAIVLELVLRILNL